MQALERGRGQDMDGRGVKKSTRRQGEVGDGVPMLETFHIQPVLFGDLLVGRAPLTASDLFQPHFALERGREDSGGVGLFGADRGTVRERDSRGRQLHAGYWSVN